MAGMGTQPTVRFSRLQWPLRRAAIGAEADWQLSASAVVTGNGKNWGGSRQSAF